MRQLQTNTDASREGMRLFVLKPEKIA